MNVQLSRRLLEKYDKAEDIEDSPHMYNFAAANAKFPDQGNSPYQCSSAPLRSVNGDPPPYQPEQVNSPGDQHHADGRSLSLCHGEVTEVPQQRRVFQFSKCFGF